MVALPLGPAELDISGIRAGDLNQIQLTITAGGRPIDLTGKTLEAQVRRSYTSTGKLDAVIEVIDQVAGVITLRWPGEEVRTWLGTDTSALGVWDLELTDGTDDPTTIIAGTFHAELDVTHD